MHTLTYYSGKAGKSYYYLYASMIHQLTDRRKVNYIDRRVKSVLDLVALGFSITLSFSIVARDTRGSLVACKGQTIYPGYLLRKVFMTQLARPMAIHLPILLKSSSA